MFTRKAVLVVRFIDMPDDVQEELQNWHLFYKDCFVEPGTSYRLGDDEQIPENMLKEANFHELYDFLKGYDNFPGNFDEFLGRYRLRTLHWMALQNLDLKGIDSILVDTHW